MQKIPKSSNHKHIIGLLYNGEHQELVTLEDLERHIQKQQEFNDMIMRDPFFAELKQYMNPDYTMRHYGDWRCRTDLHRFMCCPECGEAINWKRLRDTGKNNPDN